MTGRCLLALLATLCGLLAAPAGAAEAAPLARAGRLELPTLPAEAVPLRGEWGFAWHQFVDPSWQSLPAQAVATVPSHWNELTADGKPRGENGWGSYVLQVDCPRGQSLAVEAMGERTTSRLFINGTLVAQHGTPAPDAAHNQAAIYNRVPITPEFACPLRLTLHVANYDHRAGGFVRPMMAGTEAALERQRERQVVYGAGLLTVYLLTGLVSLIMFAVRPRERVPLVFGLFCVAMAIYTDMIGERLFLRGLPDEIDWIAYMRVEYVSWIAAMALFLVTLRGLFPQEIHRIFMRVALAVLALAALSVFVLPPGIYSYVATPGQAIAVGVAIYIADALLRAGRRAPADARVLLVGLFAVLVTMGVDLLLIDAPRPDKKFAPIGFALFMLSPAVVIARRLASALNAEERNRTLEENARLREDVERMSRHDLKTPLNSILGASRLLRDEGRLTREQGELVDVVQQAGTRMLEMVNLSLSLFRMETGSYEFRPQSVDLREVLTRVLVDLHAYAEAARVTLHLQGSPRAPTWVRGEEPLAYSILANLVKNAVEATPPGGTVTLALQPGDPVVVTVHNPGEVPPAIAQRFFEKYVTNKSGGTGLGTYSARLMARAQEGDVQVRTGAAEGTTLSVSLPAARSESADAQPALAHEDSLLEAVARLPARDVLVVDDDEFTRLVTRRLLPSPPFRVQTASNGLQAMELMGRHWPDLVLMDMEMPQKSGLETVRWIREQEAALGRPRCRIVMLSANDGETVPGRALLAGADRFLAKPATRERLLATLLELERALAEDSALAAARTNGPAASGEPPEGGEEILVVEPEWAEAFPAFLSGFRDSVEGMARALAEGDRVDLQFLAHRLAGGLSAMGLHWASRESRQLERDALEGAAEQLDTRIRGLREHLRKVRIETA
ncbi:response regulator [Ramlibacter ginsenosidimutans]|uniref:histidine kinase n=1 Tax=Ramlibacter ginsenosidimutans TaxID=502333 RepID=A0A934TXY8_9BURK|nr:response regulator [Ramlibacter ginsenosidimutans]MBK6009311.1 response regulator [Ramlibacter ginsenosidimutans]